MTMPNFLIIGAQKSGTTALYHYLRQHPQIYMSPKKETNFFALESEKLNSCEPATSQSRGKRPIDNISAYRELFQDVANEIAIGEASPWYLYNPKVPERIQHYLPSVQLIAVLRNPSERAYSHFLNSVRDGVEPLTDFAQALQEEEIRVKNNFNPMRYHYQQIGFYYVQLKRYFDRFDKNQIRIYLHEDFKADPTNLLQDIFQFLAVDDAFIPDMSRKFNVSGVPKNQALQALFNQQNIIKSVLKPFLPQSLRKQLKYDLRNQNLDKPDPLPSQVKQQLVEVFRADILKLEDLIQRDLSKWLE